MTKQLTLSLNEETVKRAERISESRGKTISLLVEELLNSIPENVEAEETAVDRIKKIMTPYINKLNLPENTDYKEMIGEWRHEDYIENSNERMKNK